MDDEERLAQLSNDLNEAHTLVEIARRTVWSAESDPENLDEPSARMRQILDHLDLAHAAIDTIIDEVESEREGTIGPREGHRARSSTDRSPRLPRRPQMARIGCSGLCSARPGQRLEQRRHVQPNRPR